MAETVGNAKLHGTFASNALLVCWILNQIKDRTDRHRVSHATGCDPILSKILFKMSCII